MWSFRVPLRILVDQTSYLSAIRYTCWKMVHLRILVDQTSFLSANRYTCWKMVLCVYSVEIKKITQINILTSSAACHRRYWTLKQSSQQLLTVRLSPGIVNWSVFCPSKCLVLARERYHHTADTSVPSEKFSVNVNTDMWFLLPLPPSFKVWE